MNAWEVCFDSDRAIAPSRAYERSAGYDLAAPTSYTIEPGTTSLIDFELKVALGSSSRAWIVGRSSSNIAGLLVFPGLVDPDYRGRLKAVVHNLSTAPITVSAGSRVAQLVIEDFADRPMHVVLQLSSSSQRASQGFGSSGDHV